MRNDIPLFITPRTTSREDPITSFGLYAPALYKYAFCLYNDPGTAAKFVGSVYAKLYEDLLDGKISRINLRSHLYTTAYQLLVQKQLHSDHSVPIRVVSWKYPGDLLAGTGAEDRVLVENVHGALRNDLTDDQRHVVILRFIVELSLKETAAIMGKSVGNVKVIQNRAIAALRQAVGHEVLETRAMTLLIRQISSDSEAALLS